MTERVWPADQVRRWPISQLREYERNARTHSDSQIQQIADSITEWGWTMPIVADADGTILAGHGRLAAARLLGLSEIPVVVAENWTEEQKRAYALADNRLAELAGWDEDLLRLELGELRANEFDLSLIGFGDDELNEILGSEDSEPTDGLTDEDEVPEPPAEPVTRRGDLWILGKHRLLCGDATSADDVIRLMDGQRAQLFATDPPYLVDYDGTNHPGARKKSARRDRSRNNGSPDGEAVPSHWDDSSQGPQFYEAFIQVAIDHAIAENVAWYCWHASRRQAMLDKVWEKFDVLHHQQIIWAKSRSVLTRSVMLWAHEPCLFGWRRGKKPRVNRTAFDSWPTTVWNIPSSEIETRDHPTSKPVRVFTLPMELHTRPGEICYEPFAGSGSQLIAGERTGRRVYNMELSEAFCDVVIQRWQAFTGKIARLDGDGSFEEMKAIRMTWEATGSSG